ncbi:MAG: hypothetical protein ACRBB6_16545 [Neptuniibacter sp.]
MKKLLMLIFLTLPGYSVASGYGSIPEHFFSYIKTGETEKAIDFLYNTNRWVSKNSDQVINLKSQLKSLDGLVGKYLFHELISEEKVGTHYAHLIYLVGYERQPLRFEIKVYKPGNTWRFQGVSFDADLTDDIEKQANLKLID